MSSEPASQPLSYVGAFSVPCPRTPLARMHATTLGATHSPSCQLYRIGLLL